MKTASPTSPSQTVYPILFAISFSHLLNDTIQSLIPAIYPLLKDSFTLSFSQIGIITLVFQMSSSLFQPVVGTLTDRRPFPLALPLGMSLSLAGIILMAFAPSFEWILVSVALIGLGSSVFHPEASRMAHAASGGKRGLAQSIFQVGGNAGGKIQMFHFLQVFTVLSFTNNISWNKIIINTQWIIIYIFIRAGVGVAEGGTVECQILVNNERRSFRNF